MLTSALLVLCALGGVACVLLWRILTALRPLERRLKQREEDFRDWL
jgi:hypothetical protein